MKTPKRSSFLTLLAIAISLSLSACSSTPSSPEVARTFPASDIDGCGTFIVSNASSHTIGTVTISGASSNTQFHVDSIGAFSETVCFAPTSATLDGTVCPYPDTTIVSLSSGTVAITWPSSSLLEIIDYLQQN